MTCVHRFRDTQAGPSFGVWFYEMTVEKEHPLMGVVCHAGEVTRKTGSLFAETHATSFRRVEPRCPPTDLS